MRDVHADAAPAVSTRDEKLRYIPDIRVASDFRAALHQNETGLFAINPDQQRMAVRLHPIQRQARVAEAPIRAQLYRSELAEIVRIQLKQIR